MMLEQSRTHFDHLCSFLSTCGGTHLHADELKPAQACCDLASILSQKDSESQLNRWKPRRLAGKMSLAVMSTLLTPRNPIINTDAPGWRFARATKKL